MSEPSVIFKYRVADHGDNRVEMPRAATVVSVGGQNGEVVLWARVCPSEPPTTRHIRAVFTGEPFDLSSAYYFAGTVQMADGIVVHVFDGGWTPKP